MLRNYWENRGKSIEQEAKKQNKMLPNSSSEAIYIPTQTKKYVWKELQRPAVTKKNLLALPDWLQNHVYFQNKVQIKRKMTRNKFSKFKPYHITINQLSLEVEWVAQQPYLFSHKNFQNILVILEGANISPPTVSYVIAYYKDPRKNSTRGRSKEKIKK